MKKKLFLVLSLVVVLVCCLAISASALTIKTVEGKVLEVTTYNDAPVKTNIIVSTDDLVVFNDDFVCPTGYVFKDVKEIANGGHNSPTVQSAFDFTYIKEKTGKEYKFSDIVSLDLPQGLTYVGGYAMHKVGLKRVTFPNSVTGLGMAVFQDCSGLLECVFEHDEKSNLTTLPGWFFANCTSLRAICLPDCIQYFGGTESSNYTNSYFASCTGVSAVYLPKNLKKAWGGGNSGSVFGQMKNAYFVNEPFTYDNIPSKPDVYYFPSELDTLTGETFDTCQNLNSILVFGTKLTTLDNAWAFESVKSGGDTKPTVVFLGNVVNMAVGSWNVQAIYFANENDIDATSLTLSGSKTIYYCHGANNNNHLIESKATQTNAPATCETNRFDTTYCFCGTKIDDNKEIADTKLGHDYTVLSSISYADYAAEGIKIHSCSRDNCESTRESAVEAIIAKFSGYSVPTNPQKVGITFRYEINRTALEEYNSINEDLKFGVVGVVEAFANGNKPLTNDCQINSEIAANVIFADISESNTKVVDFVILGSAELWESKQVINGVETNLKDLAIIMAGYIYDGAGVHYIQSKGTMQELESVSYSQVNSAQ